MSVAAVPEGLPAVVTISLALGAQRMLRRKALIRKLPAVETLGSVTVICSDKTGTLTQNRMTVTVLDVAGHRADLTEPLYQEMPVLQPGDAPLPLLAEQVGLTLLLAGGALCNDAMLSPLRDESGGFQAVGDPTEGALVVAAARMGLWKTELERLFPRVAEAPFDSERRRMTTLHSFQPSDWSPGDALEQIGRSGARIAFTKGAADGLLERADQVWVGERVEPMSQEWRKRVAASIERLAQEGMRVLGVAFRRVEEEEKAESELLECNLVFVGLFGLQDPPRPEARESVRICREAGIRAVMITGDHPVTARRIARELGIADDQAVLSGQEIAGLSDQEMEEAVEAVSVFARVAPDHKLRIVQALQRRGQIVAMTGDGVNDAPALKRADIGVAMGMGGTEVAKEAADMTLLDDNFSTIVAAIEEGRVIYDNTRKFIRYLLTSNTAELWVMLLAPLIGMPLPLLPLQVLWINLVTDGLPALALSLEAAEQEAMRRPPYPPQESLFARKMGWQILGGGLLIGALSGGVGWQFWRQGDSDWQTLVFTTLTFSQMAFVLTVRSELNSLLRIGLFSNRVMLAAVLLTLLLHLCVIYAPLLQPLFHTTALSAGELGLCLGLSSVVFFGVEFAKWTRRRRGDGVATLSAC